MSDNTTFVQFRKDPLEKAVERKRLEYTVHSLDILLVTSVVVFICLWYAAGILWAIGITALLIVNNYGMYKAAYRDGFRGGYLTAMEDFDDLGFVPERTED